MKPPSSPDSTWGQCTWRRDGEAFDHGMVLGSDGVNGAGKGTSPTGEPAGGQAGGAVARTLKDPTPGLRHLGTCRGDLPRVVLPSLVQGQATCTGVSCWSPVAWGEGAYPHPVRRERDRHGGRRLPSCWLEPQYGLERLVLAPPLTSLADTRRARRRAGTLSCRVRGSPEATLEVRRGQRKPTSPCASHDRRYNHGAVGCLAVVLP